VVHLLFNAQINIGVLVHMHEKLSESISASVLFWCGDFGRKLDIVDVRLDIIDLLRCGRDWKR
jgi:hypothetical protein